MHAPYRRSHYGKLQPADTDTLRQRIEARLSALGPDVRATVVEQLGKGRALYRSAIQVR
jgi:hypothetical protein